MLLFGNNKGDGGCVLKQQFFYLSFYLIHRLMNIIQPT